MMIPKLLENETISLQGLSMDDYERLYQVASDKNIWAQHPDSDRYLPAGFSTYFHKLLETDQPYLVIDKKTNKIVGATSYYQYDKSNKKVAIGYTFIATKYWGTGFNSILKNLMLDYAFTFADQVIFHVRQGNFRSQAALVKLGATKTNSYPAPADPTTIQLEYVISKKDGQLPPSNSFFQSH
ncbi:GNAT family N-acetyltransferase [Sphingobacterium sp. UT-1RO-CII-1]|uniref:GNAT family N-acetyltransferase n=1 Tax=Sphingobacterium sp. UT-1RO-CII-1 TaxID=2995225 RepID=UPI00227D28DC|nr:GNAT family N-acetyltransferase [Sphingobacterium sp. UT-1RO-CII-1]MCY4781318.1 GNAT family N-acetyltransferase [Sphingobacterium sp. UT-1RO-CII-1]